MEEIRLSSLGHTWILDLDGTLVKHNGYKTDGYDTWLDGALDFLRSIPAGDMIIIITSRTLEYKAITERFLTEYGIRYDRLIYGAPVGERLVINDMKPSGLATAIAINTDRNVFCKANFVHDESL
jgi:hypothetical protein